MLCIVDSPMRKAKLPQNEGKGKEQKVLAAAQFEGPTPQLLPERTTTLVRSPVTSVDSASRYDLHIHARFLQAEIDLGRGAVAECVGVRPSGPTDGCAAAHQPTANC